MRRRILQGFLPVKPSQIRTDIIAEINVTPEAKGRQALGVGSCDGVR